MLKVSYDGWTEGQTDICHPPPPLQRAGSIIYKKETILDLLTLIFQSYIDLEAEDAKPQKSYLRTGFEPPSPCSACRELNHYTDDSAPSTGRVQQATRAPLITTDLPIVQTGEWHSLRGHRHAASEPSNCLHPSFLKRCRSSANVMTDRPKCITIQVSASLCLVQTIQGPYITIRCVRIQFDCCQDQFSSGMSTVILGILQSPLNFSLLNNMTVVSKIFWEYYKLLFYVCLCNGGSSSRNIHQ